MSEGAPKCCTSFSENVPTFPKTWARTSLPTRMASLAPK